MTYTVDDRRLGVDVRSIGDHDGDGLTDFAVGGQGGDLRPALAYAYGIAPVGQLIEKVIDDPDRIEAGAFEAASRVEHGLAILAGHHRTALDRGFENQRVVHHVAVSCHIRVLPANRYASREECDVRTISVAARAVCSRGRS